LKDQVGIFFILKKTKYSESDLILQVLSERGEKMAFFVKGALRSKKRFGGGILEPTHLIEAIYQNPKQEEGLRLLKEAKLIEGFEALRTDYDRLETALFAVDCVSRVSLEGDQESRIIFQLLGHLFRTLEADSLAPEIDLNILRAQFGIKFLFQQGVLTPDPWMEPFLKTSLHDSKILTPLKTSRQAEFDSLVKRVHRYIHSADSE
jgi:DNA repair protein RecO (recombination protein O)